ncbi:hypothetical protein C0993_006280 [Termitomyces sp. T159_Od127]|nr:hypothetical protein C0993_006280 [Termitomyces sp. T159_Od127]
MMGPQVTALPLYTPSEPSPSYSFQPSGGENTLEYTPSQRRAPPTGIYTRNYDKITITLYGQEDGVDSPIYHQRGHIIGSLLIENPNNVIKVTIQIEGKLDTMNSESGSKSIQLLSISHGLWRKGERLEELSSHLPFSQLIPTGFTYEGVEYPLPPTFQIEQTSTSAFRIRVLYSINICVTRTRNNMEFLTKSDHYRPRIRAHRPILPSPHFFSTLKTSPDEWFQLFIPSARIYGLVDRIPFHIQLNGPLDALRRLAARL